MFFSKLAFLRSLACVFFATLFSCTSTSEINTSDEDGINPTTAFEIYDSLASTSGNMLKNMQTDRTGYTFNGDLTPVVYHVKEVYQYEYDQQQRLIKCVYTANDHRRTRTTQLEYGPDNAITKVIMNWYGVQNMPGKDIVWEVRKENGVSKIVPGGTFVPFFPPINPESDDYKNLIMVDVDKKIAQMGGTVNGFMNHYSSFTYDSSRNIEKVIFSFTNRDGQLTHIPSLAELEYTKYVRSPFQSPAFALVHHFTQHFGFSPQSDLLDFGVNMPVKAYVHDITSEETPSSRFGYQYAKGPTDLHYDFVYHYNSRKRPTLAVKKAGYPGMPVQYVDSIRFEYQ